MQFCEAGLYSGVVTHQRSGPTPHSLKYNVFSLLFPIDDLDKLVADNRWLSRNRFNMFSIYDGDYGRRDGCSLEDHVGQVVADAGYQDIVARTFLLTYPRILGYAFNPLSIYFCCDAEAEVRLIVYEVSNTFGERHTYVLPVASAERGSARHACDKEMYVSPFNKVSGRYHFSLSKSVEKLFVGILLKVDGKPRINARFCGSPRPLNDKNLTAAFFRMPFMTAKVYAGIHFEAAKLWLKRLPLQRRPDHPAYLASIQDMEHRN
ncbi:MAG: DUF1365 domain-containing protein [Stappiaceae bacterium]